MIIGGAYWWFIVRTKCKDGEQWDNDKCVLKCKDGEKLENNKCVSKCKDGEKWDTTEQRCKRKYYKCQFIKVISADRDTVKGGPYLNFAELEAYDENDTNVALNKLATQSSTFHNLNASNAVDGNKKTIMHTQKTSRPEWWQVDLGSEKNITKINLIRRDNMQWNLREDGATIQLLASDGKTIVHQVTLSNREIDQFNFGDSIIETFIKT